MYTLKQAREYAKNLSELHKEPWIVIKTPAEAKINQYPANLYNTGRYLACKQSERQEYEEGGCEVVK